MAFVKGIAIIIIAGYAWSQDSQDQPPSRNSESERPFKTALARALSTNGAEDKVLAVEAALKDRSGAIRVMASEIALPTIAIAEPARLNLIGDTLAYLVDQKALIELARWCDREGTQNSCKWLARSLDYADGRTNPFELVEYLIANSGEPSRDTARDWLKGIVQYPHFVAVMAERLAVLFPSHVDDETLASWSVISLARETPKGIGDQYRAALEKLERFARKGRN